MGQTKVEPILTVKKFKDRYLHGVSLLDDDGNAMSDNTISDKIDQATAYVQNELDLCIIPEIFQASDDTQEKRTYRLNDFFNWNYIKLNRYPVISVESVKIMFPSDNELIEYPESWFKLNKASGILRMVPDSHTVPTLFQHNSLYVPEFILSKKMVPQMIEIEYTAGFPQGEIPMDINDLIGLRAAMDILEIMGDLIIGAGIANQSIAIDGVSQNVSTTASALYGGYSARIERYQKRYDTQLKAARRYWKGITFVSI